MKSIKKRFSKIRIVSKMVQYSDETDATDPLAEEDITEESSTLTTDCTVAELCVDIKEMQNTLTYDGGSFHAVYLVEMNGVLAERAEVSITLFN